MSSPMRRYMAKTFFEAPTLGLVPCNNAIFRYPNGRHNRPLLFPIAVLFHALSYYLPHTINRLNVTFYRVDACHNQPVCIFYTYQYNVLIFFCRYGETMSAQCIYRCSYFFVFHPDSTRITTPRTLLIA